MMRRSVALSAALSVVRAIADNISAVQISNTNLYRPAVGELEALSLVRLFKENRLTALYVFADRFSSADDSGQVLDSRDDRFYRIDDYSDESKQLLKTFEQLWKFLENRSEVAGTDILYRLLCLLCRVPADFELSAKLAAKVYDGLPSGHHLAPEVLDLCHSCRQAYDARAVSDVLAEIAPRVHLSHYEVYEILRVSPK